MAERSTISAVCIEAPAFGSRRRRGAIICGLAALCFASNSMIAKAYTTYGPTLINMSQLAGWSVLSVPAVIEGTLAPGDGGQRKMVFDSANRCGAGGHPAADPAGVAIGSTSTCVNSTIVTTGSWNIDWSSVNNVATPMLFENVLTATDDTAAIAAAVATNKHVVIPTMPAAANRDWTISKDIPQTIQGQIIEGDDRTATRLVINSNAGFTKGVFVPSASAGGPKFRNLVWIFAQSGTTIGAITQYVPAVYTLNVPDTHLEHVSAYPCWDCFNFQGNSGQSTFEDVHLSAFHCGITLDGAQDTVRARDIHFFPYGMSGGTYTLYMMFPGQSGAPGQHGFCMGRVDDFKLEGSLFIGGTAMDIHAPSSAYGGGFSGQVTDSWFDVYPALTISQGVLVMNNITDTVDTDGTHGLTGFVNAGAALTINNSHLQLNSNGTASASAVAGGIISTSGDTTMSGDNFDLGSSDGPTIVQVGAAGTSHLTFSGNEIRRNANISYPNNPIVNLQAGDTVAIGNHVSSIGSGSGRFFAIGNDNGANRISWNSSPGYPAYQPSSPAGIYGSNY